MLILSAIALFAGLASGIAEAQAPTPTPSGAPTPTPPPLAWYEGDKAPWVVAFVLGALGVVAGIVLRPSLEAIGEALKRWLQALGFGFEKRYLDALVEKHRYLKFVGVRDRTKAGRPKLEDVYISLQMGAPTQMDATAVKPAELTLGEALRANKNLVILGEPGAGKSTLLRYLVLTFAGIVPVSRLGLNEKRLPIYVRLKDCIGNETPISEILTAPPTLPVSKSPPAFFEGRLRHGQCLVLLDGLDEVVDEGQKKVVTEKIAQLVGDYAGNRFVVTCRTAGWNPNLLPGSFVALKIRDLNQAQVTRFIHDWYKAVLTNEKLLTAGADAEKQTQARQTAIDEARPHADDLVTRLDENEGLARLAKNPLILSLIALVHYNREYVLPERRADLYKDCLDVLLDQWDRGEHQLILPDAPPLDVKQELAQEIACHFQINGVDEAGELDLVHLLAPILTARQCKVSAGDCLRVQIVERSGLLVERAIGRYGFAHRTLQEYLVAKHYADTQDGRADLLTHWNEEAWREVVLLYSGLVNAEGAAETVRAVLLQPDDAAHNALLLAGQCLAENKRVGEPVRGECLDRLQAAFQATNEPLMFIRLATVLAGIGGEDVLRYFERVLHNSNTNVRAVAAQALGTLGKRIAPARIAAALLNLLKDDQAVVRRAAVTSLGQLGYDDRQVYEPLHALYQTEDDPTVRTAAVGALVQLGHASDLNLVRIPAGEFTMGSEMTDSEKPSHPVLLDEYFIGRYPVTNGEFKSFVDAGGYHDPRYWEQAVADGLWKDGKFKGLYDNEPRDRARDYGPPFNLPNHPVVGITWYEAKAYALWAGMRLPTEAEWEKAASWDEASKVKRVYPWGNAFDASRCNTRESLQGARGILSRVNSILRRSAPEGGTTPVGQYSPEGDSPYGVSDMAGNVWEWCSTLYKEYPYDPNDGREDSKASVPRCLRGGSWPDGNVDARCASRDYGYLPDNLNVDIGFRVAESFPALGSGS